MKLGMSGSFSFSPDSEVQIVEILKRYPSSKSQSAVLPLLYLAQAQLGGHVTPAAMEVVGEKLSMPYIKVAEVASFYTLINEKPVGKYLVQLCRTLPCCLRGADSLREILCGLTGIRNGETTEDGLITLREMECLGACANAPVLQVNEWTYEDVDGAFLEKLIFSLKAKKPLPQGSAKGRQGARAVTKTLSEEG